jgi:hypothetical protein
MEERFGAQLLTGPPAHSAAEVTERLLAVQGQDPRGFRLAVRSRSTGLSAQDVDAALDRGTLLVTWLNRGTLHLVRSEDYWWLHALTAPPTATGNAHRLVQEGVPPDAAERGVAAVVRALEDGPATRDELRTAVDAAGVRTQGQAMAHVLILASLGGLVVRGPVHGREQAYVLTADWLGAPPRLPDRDVLLAELARRYLRGHGPASDRDLAKWAGLPLRDVRRGLAALTLTEEDDGLVDLPGRAPDGGLPPPRLLGAFDPLLLGWVSRDPVLGGHQGIVTDNGLFRPFALVGGRAVATWSYARGEVALAPFAPSADVDRAALDDDAEDVRRFFG